MSTAARFGDRFADLWHRGRLTQSQSALDTTALFEDVVRAYGEPGRRYHSMEHIEHCIRQLELVQRELGPSAGLEGDQVDAVEFGIWYHDVVYVTRAKDNEARSADLFAQIAEGVLDAARIDDVHRIIMATLHLAKPHQADECLMVDIDLSSFGMKWDHFRRDSVAVRTEMGHQSEAEFSRGHARFLNNLMARDSVYSTEFFRDLYETRARENIERYLSEFLS